MSGRVLVLVVVLASCGQPPSDPAPAPSSAGEESSALDGCGDRVGLVLEQPAPIAAEWSGATMVGGTGELTMRWCGAGALHLGQIEIGEPEESFATGELELELGPREAVRMGIPGLSVPGSARLVVRGEAGGVPVSAETTVTFVDDPDHAHAVSACEARGGTFLPAGSARIEHCDRPTADANTPCYSDASCEGACIATGTEPDAAAGCAPGEERVRFVGHCSERTVTFGCMARLLEPQTECRVIGRASRLPQICSD